MINIEFDKRVELIFGLIYSINGEYNINSMSRDTIPEYCNES